MTRYPYYQYVAYQTPFGLSGIRAPDNRAFIVHNYFSPMKQHQEILNELCRRYGVPKVRRRSKWRVRVTSTAIWLIGPGKQIIVCQKIFSNKL